MFWRAEPFLYLLCALFMEAVAGRAGPKARVAKSIRHAGDEDYANGTMNYLIGREEDPSQTLCL